MVFTSNPLNWKGGIFKSCLIQIDFFSVQTLFFHCHPLFESKSTCLQLETFTCVADCNSSRAVAASCQFMSYCGLCNVKAAGHRRVGSGEAGKRMPDFACKEWDNVFFQCFSLLHSRCVASVIPKLHKNTHCWT